ncbi:MAG: hypothetical protein HQL37_08975, partial [Alphaproteobacteria bacterium]|nr:hypothetical protein [Alphaproteobacteria bacterium]
MASLALGAVGAVIGSFFGAPGIGFMIGSSLGTLLFPAKGKTIDGPRLGDLTVTSSAYGAMIPVTFGTIRIAGNMIWTAGILETKTTSGGGKGGATPSPTLNTYSYSASFVIVFCKGPIAGVTRIWGDGKLIYDARTVNTGVFYSSGSGITIHLGTETQEPDAHLQANIGIDATPAFRGLAYIVFDALQLANFGNHIPNITAEIARNITGTCTSIQASDTGYLHDLYALGSGGAFFYYGCQGNTLCKVDAVGNTLLLSDTVGAGTITAITYNFGVLYVACMEGNYGRIYQVDEGTLTPTTTSGYLPSARDISVSRYGTVFGFGILGAVTIGMTGGDTIPLALNDYAAIPDIQVYGPDIVAMSCAGAGDDCWAIGGSPTTSSLYHVTSDGGVVFYDLSGCLAGANLVTYDPGTNALFIGSNTSGSLIKWSVASAAITGAVIPDVVGTFSNSAFKQGVSGRTLWCTRNQNACAIDTVTLATTSTVNLGTWGTLICDGVCFETACNALWTTGYKSGHGAVKILLDRVDSTGTTLDRVATEIAGLVGLTPDQLDVSSLAGTPVLGYVIGTRSTARACIEQLMQAFSFDAVESGGLLRFVVRGQAACLNLGTEDLACDTPGNKPAPQLAVTRAQDIDLPSLVNVLYMNPDADYQQGHQYARRLEINDQRITVQIPVVLTDTQAARVAEVLLYSAWTERNQVDIQVQRRYAGLEPTDVITVADEYTTQTLRIINATLGADGLYKITGLTEDGLSYVSARTGIAASAPNSTIVAKGPTTLLLLDCAMLRDEDDDPGFYAAVTGQNPNWNGATVSASADGQTWSNILTFVNGTVAGVAITVLPDCPHWETWDRISIVDVRMVNGDFSSAASELDVLNGANAVILGDEILQFATVLEISAGVYRLSNLLRGRRGSEWACGTHAIGERMVTLDPTTIQRVTLASAA